MPLDKPIDARVSVVIPCHNHARYLADAIDSAFAQTCCAVQVIVVDDGSSDDTAQVAAGYGDRVVLRHQPHRGPGAARNAGLAIASGDFVAFLDADDALASDFLAECLKALAERPDAAFAFTQLQRFGRRQDVTHFPPYESVSWLRRRIPVCALFRRRALIDVGFDERLRSGLEDLDLYLSIAEHGGTGVLVDRPLVYYRQDDQQGSITDRLLANPLRRWALHSRLMWRHRSQFSLRDWVIFSYELAREAAHDLRVHVSSGDEREAAS